MKSHFKFNKQERSGIFFLLLFIIILQGVYFFVKVQSPTTENGAVILNEVEQAQVDSLKVIAKKKVTRKFYSFNPNFISDYKGYTLGMSPREIDRLHAFRKTDSYVNSAKQFQEVTKITDSLLDVLAPYFKFLKWTESGKPITVSKNRIQKNKSYSNSQERTLKDLNLANIQDLITINGIGDKLSARIVKFRDRLGGFLVNEQLYDVYGLEDEVVERALQQFQVINPPIITKININSASTSEIAKLIYIPYNVAERIVEERELNSGISSFNQLLEIDGFPVENLDRIILYLSL